MKKVILLLMLVAVSGVANAAPKVQLKLEQKNELLFARIVVSQDEDRAGQIILKWRAPQDSYCQDSIQRLKYQYKTYHTSAYRTLHHKADTPEVGNTHSCIGNWRLQVLDETNHVLASSHYDFYE